MNKIYKYCAAAFAGLLALTLGSCTSEYEYDAAVAEGQQVYFSSSLASKVELSSTASSFTVPINRIKTDEALTVNLSLTDESKLFTAPTSASFLAGESSTNVTISYDPSNFSYDDFKNLVLTITDADYTTPYGASSYSFSAGVPSPWTSLGVGKFIDSFFYGEAIDLEIQQNDLNSNLFRVVNPYKQISEEYAEAGYAVDTDARSDYFEFTVMQAGQTLAGVTMTQSDLVYYSPVCTGIDVGWTGGSVYLYHPAAFSSRQSEAYWTHNYVEAYQDNGLPGAVSIAPLYITAQGYGSDQSTVDDVIQIIFPGYELSDYSVEVAYTGAFIDTKENTYAMGNVKLGSDVEEAKVAVVEGNDVEQALNDVLNGTVETTSITESGDVKIECPYSGTCTMIAVSYAGGEPMDYGYATFNFNVGGSDWKTLGTGLYTDYVFAAFLEDQDGNQGLDPIQYEVEVQEHKTQPGLYRILHPYAPDTYGYLISGDYYDESGDYNIIINATDPSHVYIEPQSTGIPVGNYGDLMVLTVGGLNIAYSGYSAEDLIAGGYVKGTLSNGVITFPTHELLYAFSSEVAQGYAGYIYDKPTSVLTLPSAVTAKASSKAKAAKKHAPTVSVKKNISKQNLKKVNSDLRFKMVKHMESPNDVELK